MSERIPDFFLEQYRLGEVDEATAARIEADAAAMERLRELDEDSERLLRAVPPADFAAQVRRRAESSQESDGAIVPFLRRHPGLIPAVAAALLILAVLPVQWSTSGRSEPPDQLATGERVKGLEPEISVFRRGDAGTVEELSDGSVAGAGDRIQISYNAAGAAWGCIFSVDGNGVVTLHYPESLLGDGRLEQGGEVALSFSYILDDAPDFERFYFAYGDDPIDIAALITSVEAAIAGSATPQTALEWWASDRDQAGFRQLTLRKEGR